jgi:hypothetical protein
MHVAVPRMQPAITRAASDPLLCAENVAITDNTSQDLTLSAGTSTAVVTTQHNRNMIGTNDHYTLDFNVSAVSKLPVAVALVSGPNVLIPMDIGECTNCGKDQFNFSVNLNSARPTLGDTEAPPQGGASLYANDGGGVPLRVAAHASNCFRPQLRE